MPRKHLISIDESQLKNPPGDKDEFLRALGSAVVLACLGPDSETISINLPGTGAHDSKGERIVTVEHVLEHDQENFEIWMWASSEGVAIAELSPSQLKIMREIVEARQMLQ
jgi:hypothetical protein